MTVLLDTHVLLWWQAGGERLSRVAAAAIDAATAILISPLTFWEVATLHRLGRIALDREPASWVANLLQGDRLELVSLTAEAATWAGQIDDAFPGDPIDRMLYATARDRRVRLISKDEPMRAFARVSREVEIVW
jgi:PIN domain nuclease of toxin-antitoxin system